MLAFTALDIRELAHQMHQARPGLATLAATVAVLHLLAAVDHDHGPAVRLGIVRARGRWSPRAPARRTFM